MVKPNKEYDPSPLLSKMDTLGDTLAKLGTKCASGETNHKQLARELLVQAWAVQDLRDTISSALETMAAGIRQARNGGKQPAVQGEEVPAISDKILAGATRTMMRRGGLMPQASESCPSFGLCSTRDTRRWLHFDGTTLFEQDGFRDALRFVTAVDAKEVLFRAGLHDYYHTQQVPILGDQERDKEVWGLQYSHNGSMWWCAARCESLPWTTDRSKAGVGTFWAMHFKKDDLIRRSRAADLDYPNYRIVRVK